MHVTRHCDFCHRGGVDGCMVKHEIQLSVFYHSGEVGTAAVHYIAAPGFDIIFRHSQVSE